MMTPRFSISIVSHGHGKYIERLIGDLVRLNRPDIEVILTLNLPESFAFDFSAMPFDLRVIKNDRIKGFASNHNDAFSISKGENFVILNPDIKLGTDPFDVMLSVIKENPNCICAPLIVNKNNKIEDSARNFPSPVLLGKRLLSRVFHFSLPMEVLVVKGDVIMPDWVAGMFMVIPREIYKHLHGLSERYHMYFEDVDLCARARLAGYQVLVNQRVSVIHEAQRDSHRKLQYLSWHVQSAMKFFTSSAYLKISANRLLANMSRK
ncbi:glycosyltransferase family 2 protein [Collimonas sp. H4R21]|uniref:Glycosyltransferase family 2 protein n=1 Tax=Collimonas rhizosphaerae TaxID=3126357 RepID=A0ABU9PZQ0_9BURK